MSSVRDILIAIQGKVSQGQLDTHPGSLGNNTKQRMGVVVHCCKAKFGGWGEEDCCKFEVSLGCTVIYSPELTTTV